MKKMLNSNNEDDYNHLSIRTKKQVIGYEQTRKMLKKRYFGSGNSANKGK